MKTRGVLLVLILLAGSLVSPIGFSYAQVANVPNAPTNLAASAVSSSQINLSWTAPVNGTDDQVSGYKIERRDSCAGNFSVLIANTSNTNTEYSNTGLVNGTCYQYRIFVHNAVGTSLASNNATATTPQVAVPIHVPSAPTGLNVMTLSNSTLKLTWNAPSDNGGAPITGYKIQRNGTTLVNNTATVQTNYTDSGLLSNHQQTYRVAAWNSAGLGSYSNNMTGKTANQAGTIPTDVDNLGQIVSEFVHRQNALYKQQREETIKAIKDCNDLVRNAIPETRKQVREDCKHTLKEIREKYQDARKQFQVEFKEFRENAKLLLKEAKKSKIIDKRDVKEFNRDIKDIAKETKKQDKELKKEVKQIKKELKKEIKELEKESKKSKDKSDKDDEDDD